MLLQTVCQPNSLHPNYYSQPQHTLEVEVGNSVNADYCCGERERLVHFEFLLPNQFSDEAATWQDQPQEYSCNNIPYDYAQGHDVTTASSLVHGSERIGPNVIPRQPFQNLNHIYHNEPPPQSPPYATPATASNACDPYLDMAHNPSTNFPFTWEFVHTEEDILAKVNGMQGGAQIIAGNNCQAFSSSFIPGMVGRETSGGSIYTGASCGSAVLAADAFACLDYHPISQPEETMHRMLDESSVPSLAFLKSLPPLETPDEDQSSAALGSIGSPTSRSSSLHPVSSQDQITGNWPPVVIQGEFDELEDGFFIPHPYSDACNDYIGESQVPAGCVSPRLFMRPDAPKVVGKATPAPCILKERKDSGLQQRNQEHLAQPNLVTAEDEIKDTGIPTWDPHNRPPPLPSCEAVQCGSSGSQSQYTKLLPSSSMAFPPKDQGCSSKIHGPSRPRRQRDLSSSKPVPKPANSHKDDFEKRCGRFNINTGKPYSRGRFTPEKKQKAALTRKGGACFLCRISKKECSPWLVCENCSDKAAKAGAVQELCFRLDLQQCGFFRTKSALWPIPLRERGPFRWAELETVMLTLQCSNYGNRSAPTIKLQARRFFKEETDIIVKKYGYKAHQALVLPTYAIVDTRDIRAQAEDYLDQYLDYYLSIAWDEGNCEIQLPYEVLRTIDLARKFVKRGQAGSEVIRKALRVWTGSRICGARWSLAGGETLGLNAIDDPGTGFHGYVPIPPMVDYQIDTALIDSLSITATKLMQTLWNLLEARKDDKRVNWWPLYLAVFIMLNNIEWVYGIQEEYAAEHDKYEGRRVHENAQQDKYDECRRRVGPMSEQMKEHWRWSARHLLYVFRYSIYRCAFKGSNPFSADHYMDAARDAGMNREEVDYLSDMIEDVGGTPEADTRTQEQKDMFDYQLFWCRGLFHNKKE